MVLQLQWVLVYSMCNDTGVEPVKDIYGALARTPLQHVVVVCAVLVLACGSVAA
jgi:hypothetical protein